MKRSAPLRRRVPVRRKNARRLKRLRAKQFGPQAALARTMPCCSCGAPPPSDPSHVKARGMGGCNSDDSFVVPQCRACHDRLDFEGPSFWVRRKINVFEVMSRMRAMVLDAELGEGLAVNPLLAWLDS